MMDEADFGYGRDSPNCETTTLEARIKKLERRIRELEKKKGKSNDQET